MTTFPASYIENREQKTTPCILRQARMALERFDFVRKASLFPDRVRAVLDRNLGAALSTVYLDVNTEICNHACSFCDGFYRPLRSGHIPWPRLERLVAEMQELGVLSVVLAGDRGEPLLHPEIDALLSRLVDAAIQVPGSIRTER